MILAIFEPRVSSARAEEICKKTRLDKFEKVEAKGFAGGIWLFWDSNLVEIDLLASTDHVLTCLVKRKDDVNWILSAVYASPCPSAREGLWDYLLNLSKSISLPWLVAGDLNEVTEGSKKIRGKPISLRRCQQFLDCIDKCGLMDLGFSGPSFTWSNMRKGRGVIKERLDRALCNQAWRMHFTEAWVRHLPRTCSDHHPILIHVTAETNLVGTNRPFRFEAAWLTHDQFKDVLRANWQVDLDLASVIDRLDRKSVV